MRCILKTADNDTQKDDIWFYRNYHVNGFNQ